MLPRSAKAFAASRQWLRRRELRLRGLVGDLAKAAAAVADSDRAARAPTAPAPAEASEASDFDFERCFQLPLLAAQAGVGLPLAGRAGRELAHAVAYPFQRSQGAVRTWHVWVDRFSIVFSRFLAKLVYQLKAMTASLDYNFLQGAGSQLFWGTERLLLSEAEWPWPRQSSHQLRLEHAEVTLAIVISNRTWPEVVEKAWNASMKLYEVAEFLHILLIEDSIREPWETSVRPVFASELALRARRLTPRPGKHVRLEVLWRRHQATLSIEAVAAANANCANCAKALSEMKLVMLDARAPAAFHVEDAVQKLARGKGLTLPGVFHFNGRSVQGLQAMLQGSLKENLKSLGPYLEFHKRAVQAWAGQPSGDGNFRALVYVCNPFTLCGGHGDRTNGILSAFIVALMTSRAFFIDFDSPLPLGLVLQPRLAESELLLDWRLNGLRAMGHGSQSFYLDDRIALQEDLTWLLEDSSQVLQLSMNHRELSAILVLASINEFVYCTKLILTA